MAVPKFDESLVAFIDGAETPADVESKLAQVLLDHGYVKDSFAPALLSREEEYPTALELGTHNVAIPHTEAEHTIEGSICVGVLRNAVNWRRMDDSDESCDVELVVMLALSDPHGHLEMLQKVIAFVQDQELVEKVLAAKTAEEVVSLAGPHLV